MCRPCARSAHAAPHSTQRAGSSTSSYRHGQVPPDSLHLTFTDSRRALRRGDYFVAACPGGASQSVVVHQLSKRSSQSPFRKSRGKVAACQFHPSKPLLLVAGETNVRIYNLVKQALTKTLLAGGGVIAAMHVHPGGDHVLVGTEDNRCLWCGPSTRAPLFIQMRY